MSYDTSIYDLLFNSPHDYGLWGKELFKQEKAIRNFAKLIDSKVVETGEYYPKPDNVFRALRETPLEAVKVCLWGQDPYKSISDKTGECLAQGLSFSVNREEPVPPTLQNMYKELNANFPMFVIPEHGDLTAWARQGVLLMNNSLTFCPTNEKLYNKLWRRFTYLIITIINERVDGCIHVLLGKDAQDLATHIRSRNIILASHPSPLSCYRGFFGSNIFIKINITLKNQEKEEIDFNKINTELVLDATFVDSLKKKSL